MANYDVLTDYFLETAHRFSGKVCMQIKTDDKWQRYTFSQTEGFVRQIAMHFQQSGIGKGDFVILILDNCPEWAFFYLGILLAGACVVPVDPQAGIIEIEKISQSCKAKAIVLSRQIFSEKDFTTLKTQFHKIIIKDLPLEPVQDDIITSFEQIRNTPVSQSFQRPQIMPEDYASLIYTSGTTGQPKGVLLSHGNFCHNIKSMRDLKMCTTGDTSLCLLPLFHSYAFMGGLIAPLLIGATVTFCLSFKPEDVTGTIKEASVTLMTAVPEFFSILRNKIFARYHKTSKLLRPLVLGITKVKVRKVLGDSLRLFVSGGARSKPEVSRDIAKLGIEMNEGYGLTETSPIVTLNPSNKIKYGSAGKPLPGVEIRINNPDKTGCGEILIKGPNVMQGYYKMPGLTSEVIKDGWFYSGDLGYLDNEGYLFITGRLKEMIVLSSGKNIYPEEVESVYLTSRFIKEICVIKNETQPGLYAVIYPDMVSFRKENVINIQERIKWEIENISKELATYKRVLGFTVSKEPLSRTRLGKVKRFEIVQKFGKSQQAKKIKKVKYSDLDKQLLQTEESKHAIHFMEKKFNKDILLDDSLELDLGIDSLGRIELVDNLESSLEIEISDEIIANVFTVRELLTKVNQLKKTGISSKTKEFAWKDMLFKLPPGGITDRVRINPTLMDRAITLVLSNLFWCFFKVFCLLKVTGRNNLPKKGPFMICPNHTSYFDAFILAASLPMRLKTSTFFLGYSAIFERPDVRWTLKFARLVPIDPNANLSQSLQVSSYLLRSSKLTCIFPEGTRSIDGKVQKFKKGVAILAKELNVPIVPVYIDGAFKAWPRGQKFPKLSQLTIVYGKPMTASRLLKHTAKTEIDSYQMIANALRDEVLKLKP